MSGDAQYRASIDSPKGWWLQCTPLFGWKNQELKAKTTCEAKKEASEYLAKYLIELAESIKHIE